MKYAPGSFPKRCTCCGLLHTAEKWAELKPSGKGDGLYRVDGVPVLAMRDCVCGSTLAVELVPVVTVEIAEVAEWL